MNSLVWSLRHTKEKGHAGKAWPFATQAFDKLADDAYLPTTPMSLPTPVQ